MDIMRRGAHGNLLKVKFQVSTCGPEGGIGRGIWRALRDIHAGEGWRRGCIAVWARMSLVTRAVGGSTFSFMISSSGARRSTRPTGPCWPLNTYSFPPKCVTAILTNPIWVAKGRTFTAPSNSPAAHRGLWSGFRTIFRDEGWGGLYRGTLLALVGVSNGALQFMSYERMKGWAFERKRRRVTKLGRDWTTDDGKLSNTAYTLMSGTSKLGAPCTTYPYQVIRSRIQVDSALARTHRRCGIAWEDRVAHSGGNEAKCVGVGVRGKGDIEEDLGDELSPPYSHLRRLGPSLLHCSALPLVPTALVTEATPSGAKTHNVLSPLHTLARTDAYPGTVSTAASDNELQHSGFFMPTGPTTRRLPHTPPTPRLSWSHHTQKKKVR